MSQADRTANNVEPLFHPASHYDSVEDILDDASLSTGEKRVILWPWASDMYVVKSHPTLREVPGLPRRVRLDDILAALKQLDEDTDPPPRGGMAMRLPRLSKIECDASKVRQQRGGSRRTSFTQDSRAFRWTREANVRRYRKLLGARLTDVERLSVERRLAEELQHCSVPAKTMERIDVC